MLQKSFVFTLKAVDAAPSLITYLFSAGPLPCRTKVAVLRMKKMRKKTSILCLQTRIQLTSTPKTCKPSKRFAFCCLSPIPPFKDPKSLRMRILGCQSLPGVNFLRICMYKMSMVASRSYNLGPKILVTTRDNPIARAPDTRENTTLLQPGSQKHVKTMFL